MSRIKIKLPSVFSFTVNIPIRITDINYGNHVGNDALLSIIHEARVQFLKQYGYTELNCGGTALIMNDVGIEFKKELFYGDHLQVKIAATEFSSIGFDLYYQLEKIENGTFILVAKAKTGMTSFDYAAKQIINLPDAVRKNLETIH